MLNIISNEIFKPESKVTGQTKVFRNLIKGLSKINYPYVLNKEHEACDKLWIYNDWKAVRYIKNINTTKIKIIFGPDISIFNIYKKGLKNNYLKNCLALQPSKWAKNYLLQFGFNYCSVDYWPVGIDTEEFKPIDNRKDLVLIYFKQRHKYELLLLEKCLRKLNIKYKVLGYGNGRNYTEDEYKDMLSRSKYMIWLGRQESQGIAMGEALSMNVPILVWEVCCAGHWDLSGRDSETFSDEEIVFEEATSGTYFDETCGIIFKNVDEIEKSVMYMEKNLNTFSPRLYVLNNLSLEKQARDFLALFDKHWNSDISDNTPGRLAKYKNWKNQIFWENFAKIYYKLKK